MKITVQKGRKKNNTSHSHRLKNRFQYGPVSGVFIMPRLLIFSNPKAKRVCSFLEKIHFSLYYLLLIIPVFVFLLRTRRFGKLAWMKHGHEVRGFEFGLVQVLSLFSQR